VGASVNLTNAILAAASPGIKGDALTITANTVTGTLGAVTLVNGQISYCAAMPALLHTPANGSQADSFGTGLSDTLRPLPARGGQFAARFPSARRPEIRNCP
jgi:hypothetical protein